MLLCTMQMQAAPKVLDSFSIYLHCGAAHISSMSSSLTSVYQSLLGTNCAAAAGDKVS